MPHDRIAADIATNARLPRGASGDFAIVFTGMGLPHDSAEYFRRRLEQGGALERTALFLNHAADSSTQRLLTQHYALTAAEYLAFVEGKHVLAILTMPSDDITHPIPDLTGYITEGQIVLSRDLDRRAINPPVNVLPSLSRLMKDGTGEKYTHRDHRALASQLYSAYARAERTQGSPVGVAPRARTGTSCRPPRFPRSRQSVGRWTGTRP